MLTTKKIKDTPVTGKMYYLWDDNVRGFGVRVSKAGTKAYILTYRLDGKKRFYTIARVDEITLGKAREFARREISRIRLEGQGPSERAEDRKEAPTVSEGLDRYFNEYVPVRIDNGLFTENSLRHYRNQADNYVRPALGNKRIADVTRQDIEKMLVTKFKSQETQKSLGCLQDKPTQRNRVLAFVSRLFNLFEAWELRPQHTNPVRGIDRAREQSRARVMDNKEMAALATALHTNYDKSPAAIAAILTAAVSGLRISEVLKMEWEHVDFETGRVWLPSTKTGARSHDLPTAALTIIHQLKNIKGNPWIFTRGRHAHVTYKTVRRHFAEIAKEAGLDDVRLHDLRRTVMTRAAGAGVGTHVLRDLLGHKTTAMADRYIRAVGDPVREAREQVGSQIAEEMGIGKEKAKVIPFKKSLM